MTLPADPWSLSSCVALQQRDAMVRFWLAAPADQLEPLWNSAFGLATRDLVRGLTPQHTFSSEQVSLREAIASRLNQGGLSQPLAPQLMLANFLLSPPGLLRINNAQQFFPAWLAAAYRELYEVVAPVVATPASQPSAPVAAPPAAPDRARLRALLRKPGTRQPGSCPSA